MMENRDDLKERESRVQKRILIAVPCLIQAGGD